MIRSSTGIVHCLVGLALLGPAAAGPLHAAGEEPPASPVRSTVVERRSVRGTVRLPGTVESRKVSEVASEVAGVVTDRVVHEGDPVRRGEPLVLLRTTNLELELAALEGQLKEAEARLDLARRSLGRAEDLLRSSVIAQEELDDAVSNFEAWTGRRDDLLARIERVRVDLDRCRIEAPYDGAVVREYVEVGEWIDVGDPVMEIVALEALEVRVDVPERYYPRLSLDDPAGVILDALSSRRVEGTVNAIVARADPQARTFPVKVGIENPDRRIGVGMLAEVLLEVGEERQALLVPKDAVVNRGKDRFVYRIAGDDTVEPVRVDTGTGVGVWITVEAALEPGDRVVTRGNERLRPGQRVRAEPMRYELP